MDFWGFRKECQFDFDYPGKLFLDYSDEDKKSTELKSDIFVDFERFFLTKKF